jgi:ribosomal protein L11 methyltransferase
MKYTEYEFFTTDEVERDWLISILGDNHFEGFEETTASLKAYVPSENMRPLLLKELLYDNDFHDLKYSSTEIEEKNWNEEWEKNFEPIIVANRVAIRAPFHSPMAAEYEIVIEPKMSFGTGHHATTALVIELMLNENFDGKSVLDFGSGTGILAILAEKLGASEIIAIDNEEWAYNNCIENTARNSCNKITTIKGDESYVLSKTFDVILANINLNVVVANIGAWSKLLAENGLMIVSGILINNEVLVVNEARKHNLVLKDIVRKDGWIAASFQHL